MKEKKYINCELLFENTKKCPICKTTNGTITVSQKSPKNQFVTGCIHCFEDFLDKYKLIEDKKLKRFYTPIYRFIKLIVKEADALADLIYGLPKEKPKKSLKGAKSENKKENLQKSKVKKESNTKKN